MCGGASSTIYIYIYIVEEAMCGASSSTIYIYI